MKTETKHTYGTCIGPFCCAMHKAAPDMLGELLRAETIISDHVNGVERTAWPEVLDGIRAAIAKARGET